MRSLLFIGALLISFSGISQEKEMKKEFAKKAVAQHFHNVEGVVKYNRDGCGPFLEVDRGGKLVAFFPENMPKEFSKKGQKIKFDYRLAQKLTSPKCGADRIVRIKNVRAI